MVDYPAHNYASGSPSASFWDARSRGFLGDELRGDNLAAVLTHASAPVHMTLWSAPGRTRPSFAEAKAKLNSGSSTRTLDLGFQFGPSWTQHWIKLTADVPAKWAGGHVELNFDPSCEAMIFAEDGLALQGITGGFDYNRRVEYIVPEKEVKRGKVVRYIEVSANGVFGVGNTDKDQRDIDDKYYKLATAELKLVNVEARQLSYDFQTLLQLWKDLPDHSPLSALSRRVGNLIMDNFRVNDPASIGRCRKIAEEVLGQDWAQNALHEAKHGTDDGTLWAVGHCHIDTAWLWPWGATRQKIARSWSNQIDLMNQFPEHRFVASAAQHYKWLEHDYPQLFARLQEKIKAGKFEYNGGNWVEMDTVIPSGESLARQFLYGQRYWKKTFGAITETCILPDSFGFTAQLPQIARLAGCPNFFTHKLNWNTVNTFPLTTFNWVGLDGSQVLTHITPILRYDSYATLDEVMRAYPNNKNLDTVPESLICYGHGDGGGGPTPIMMERLRRERAAAETHDKSGAQMPKVKTGVTMGQFYDMLRNKTDGGRTLATWNGEMYLEIHRGAFTKDGNRKGEILLREIEYVSTMADLFGEYEYPKAEIDELWENILLCQFHDTMSGSMIHLATVESDALYRETLKKGHALLLRAAAAISDGNEGDFVHQTLPNVARREVITGYDGKPTVAECEVGHIVGTIAKSEPKHPVRVKENKDGVTVSNAWVSVTLADGRITSIYDLGVKRELIPEDDSAGFRVYQDDGNAWEVQEYTFNVYEDLRFTSCEIIEDTPLRVTLALELRFRQSSGRVLLSLSALPASAAPESRSLIAFDTTMQWHEKHRLLKFHLPLTLFARECTYDTAFGLTRRPTHKNTSWDAAKFEVNMHKFMDYSEHGYGVALINDNKYTGHCAGNFLGLSLLRGPSYPDAEADQGEQKFRFAVFPHLGFDGADVQGVATRFNNPFHLNPKTFKKEARVCPFFTEGDNNVGLETIKRGEDDFEAVMTPGLRSAGKKTVIIRLYEHMGGRARVKLNFKGVRVSRAAAVDLLEREIEELDVVTDTDREAVHLEFRPFEIRTVQLTL